MAENFARRSRRKKVRFLKETSERSGFDNFDRFGNKLWTSIRDKISGSNSNVSRGTILVAPDEFDQPPPSTESLGGADISGTPRTNPTSTAIPAESQPQILLVTADGITLNQEPIILIAGSSSSVDVTSNPQISRGQAQEIRTFKCVSNEILLEDGNGLSLRAAYNMDSGAILNVIYNGTDNLWQELSRSHETKNYGEF